MKDNIKRVIRFIAYLFSYVLFDFIVYFFRYFIKYLTSFYVSRKMRACGDDVEFSFPVYAHGLNYVSVGEYFKVGPRFRIEAYDRYVEDSFCPQIIIGDNVNINFDCHIACINKIIIGNNVLIASKVLITDHFHGALDSESLLLPPISRKLVSKGGVTIGDNVWIGEGAVIMPNVVIGNNSIVGANSVVTKNIPNHCVVAGNPARVIKMLDIGNH